MSFLDDLRYCVEYLAKERFGEDGALELLESAGSDEDVLFNAYRNLVNVREPRDASEEFFQAQDTMLHEMAKSKGVVYAEGLEPTKRDMRISIWRGDITALSADAIVNAANSQMLGCWVPGHYCIDNAIHTFAGVQLRQKCARLMREQGHEEPTGQAKSTPAYNLPSRHVIHTVGPIANGNPTEEDKKLLASSYESCLDEAMRLGCKTIAFCCISTGVFGFPQRKAAKIAVCTVTEWLDVHPESSMRVIFNVFTEEDEGIYHELLDE